MSATPQRVYVAATRQHDGKTVMSVGLIGALVDRFGWRRVGFMKPVGQNYIERDGMRYDEDVEVMKAHFGLMCHPMDMNPVVVGRGYTRRAIDEDFGGREAERIRAAFERIAMDKSFMLIEGTGHAGVGAVFGLSNAEVAALLESEVVLVARAGIGRPIDEIVLNAALFREKNVKVIGCILNQTQEDKLDMVRRYTERALNRLGLRLLGVVPFRKELTYATVAQIRKALNAELLYPVAEEKLEETVERIEIGAMLAHNALPHLRPRTLVITPGDREDIILAATHMGGKSRPSGQCVSALLLTGGIRPYDAILDLLKDSDIPVLFVDATTYDAASMVYSHVAKLRPDDTEKLQIAVDLVNRFVDIDWILDAKTG